MMRCRSSKRHGFTLVELMLVILVASIFAAIVVAQSDPSTQTHLYTTAQLVAADMARARSLAVTNNDAYRVTFDTANNWYYLEHSGTNAALNTLPSTPFYTSQDTATRQYTLLASLPTGAGAVTLAAVGSNGSSPAPRTQVEFQTYGQTTQTDETVIWLTAGTGTAQRWQYLRINPVTGLATVETFQGTAPPSSIVTGS
ncbi:MAG TPA: prepilin-type N-terminal cleavage/methylation domain-containing protein [Pirellulales bacterium]|jgi:prepilin-type N-terminal cleavage/methylation domain-containing protein|nr:prepilin-type N-terminal cleavage/methylation domain-containing protein [Pirellulales bacterium]